MQEIWDHYHMQICSCIFALLCNSFLALFIWLCTSDAYLALYELIAGSITTYWYLES
jgi:hypothetical protein